VTALPDEIARVRGSSALLHYFGERTCAGVTDGVAEFPKAHASMLPSGGTYADAADVAYVHVVAPSSA
jgi:hypothetical protein